MVDACGRGDGRGELGDGCRYGPVADRDGNELIENAWGPAVEDGDEDRAAYGWPDVADYEADAGEGEEVEVAVELLGVA